MILLGGPSTCIWICLFSCLLWTSTIHRLELGVLVRRRQVSNCEAKGCINKKYSERRVWFFFTSFCIQDPRKIKRQTWCLLLCFSHKWKKVCVLSSFWSFNLFCVGLEVTYGFSVDLGKERMKHEWNFCVLLL